MPFSRRLAIAIEELGADAPFLSQKQLKHVLVGVEKLVKAQAEQEKSLTAGLSEEQVIGYVNEERAKCGIATQANLLTVEEIKAHDSKLFDVFRRDIENITSYVQKGAASLAASIEEWLVMAESAGLVLKEDEDNRFPYREMLSYAVSKLVRELEFMQNMKTLCRKLVSIETQQKQLIDHIQMNVAAFRKILKRHEVHVPEHMRFIVGYREYEDLLASNFSESITASNMMRVTLEDVYERGATFPDKGIALQGIFDDVGLSLLSGKP